MIKNKGFNLQIDDKTCHTFFNHSHSCEVKISRVEKYIKESIITQKTITGTLIFTRYSNEMIKHVVPLSTIYTPMKVTRKGVNILVYKVPIKLAIKSLHSYQDVVNVE